MNQTAFSCPEKMRLSNDSPIMSCQKERHHRGPCVVRVEFEDIELEIRWRKIVPGRLELT